MDVRARWVSLDQLDESTLRAWTALGRVAPRANPFCMPQFVLPAAQWLTPRIPPQVLLVERPCPGGPELIGVACFTRERPNLFVPVAHLSSYRTLHTFRSGILHSPGHAADVAQALLADLRKQSKRPHALAFHNLPLECPVFTALRRLLEDGSGGWFEQHRFLRPTLALEPGRSADALPVMDRDLRRRKRRLEERGAFAFRIVQDATEVARAVETHLQLEHAGWKGTAGTSLLASPAQAAFFRDMMQRFAGEGVAVFAETLSRDRVVASTSNLLLGDTLNGFKTGWHPDFAACSPGRLNEVFLAAAVPLTWSSVRTFDSQAQEDSYLADLLPHRETMVTGTLAITRLGKRAMRAARLIRPVAYRLDSDR